MKLLKIYLTIPLIKVTLWYNLFEEWSPIHSAVTEILSLRQTMMRTERRIDKQTKKQAGGKTDRRIDKQTKKQAGGKTDSRRDRQTGERKDIQTVGQTYIVLLCIISKFYIQKMRL